MDQTSQATAATSAKQPAKKFKIKALRPISIDGVIHEPGAVLEVCEADMKEFTRKLPKGQSKGFGSFLNEEIAHHDQTRAELAA